MLPRKVVLGVRKGSSPVVGVEQIVQDNGIGPKCRVQEAPR